MPIPGVPLRLGRRATGVATFQATLAAQSALALCFIRGQNTRRLATASRLGFGPPDGVVSGTGVCQRLCRRHGAWIERRSFTEFYRLGCTLD